MKIDHIAIWTTDLEKMRCFYQTYFNLKSSDKYENTKKGFSSYFLSFDSGARIELMKRADIVEECQERGMVYGFAHLAISVGNKKAVDEFTERIKNDGYKVIGEPRTTGDGYYESVILDPEGNYIEITE